ncbi:MAG: hypothetical protein N2589_03635 [bacterium]|nr:hypothetical protein [bacterium]
MSKCFVCDNDAYILLKFRKNTKKYKLNICKKCLESFNIISNTKENNKKLNKCPVCGYTFEEFKEYRFLGCDFCYKCFSKDVIEYLKKIHTNVIYKGKFPESYKKEEKRIRKISQLRGSLIEDIEIINGKGI